MSLYTFLTLFQLLLVRQSLGGRLRPRTHVGGNLWVSGRTSHGSRLSELLVVFLPYRPQVPGGFCHSHGLGLLQLPWITRSSQSVHELFTSYRVFSFKKLECHQRMGLVVYYLKFLPLSDNRFVHLLQFFDNHIKWNPYFVDMLIVFNILYNSYYS